MIRVSVRAPAKVNLHHSVGPRRNDGYHELVTILQAVSLYDEVSAELDDGLTVDVQAKQSIAVDQVPHDSTNLAIRAAMALAERAGVDPNVRLTLTKSIPVAGGMAGGSADAAAALVACNELWKTGLNREDLREIAKRLGSDVPFPLFGGTALGTGRGERLTGIPTEGRFHWVFALTKQGMPTPLVYSEYDRYHQLDGRAILDPSRPSGDLMGALASGDPKELGLALMNDLNKISVRIRPDLQRTLNVGVDFGVLGASIPGTGPTCAFLIESQDHAPVLARHLVSSGSCHAAVYAYGPVGGAEIVEYSAPVAEIS
ncbi:4-(cytidine 5'-diphospho)-2-C-methyl-D-erythritol kinase [Plantactinospora sp. DSM 117369]